MVAVCRSRVVVTCYGAAAGRGWGASSTIERGEDAGCFGSRVAGVGHLLSSWPWPGCRLDPTLRPFVRPHQQVEERQRQNPAA